VTNVHFYKAVRRTKHYVHILFKNLPVSAIYLKISSEIIRLIGTFNTIMVY